MALQGLTSLTPSEIILYGLVVLNVDVTVSAFGQYSGGLKRFRVLSGVPLLGPLHCLRDREGEFASFTAASLSYL